MGTALILRPLQNVTGGRQEIDTLQTSSVDGVLKKYPTVKDALESARKEIAALRLKLRIKNKVIAARNKQIARLTKLTRILAWQRGYSRWLFPHEINTLAEC